MIYNKPNIFAKYNDGYMCWVKNQNINNNFNIKENLTLEILDISDREYGTIIDEHL